MTATRRRSPRSDAVAAAAAAAVLSPQRSPTPSRLIGQGSYGCVYRPAVPCARGAGAQGAGASGSRGRTRAWRRRTVSKLMLLRDAEDELAVADLFRAADPLGAYVALPQELCPPAATAGRATVGPACRVPRDGPLAVLQAPDAGATLGHLVPRFAAGGPLGAAGPSALLRVFAGMARGLAVLHAGGVAHLDVKPENVACRFDAGAAAPPTQCRLLDVGLGARVAGFDARASAFGQPYDLYPPAARLLYALRQRASPRRWDAADGWLARRLREYYGATVPRLRATGVPAAGFFADGGAPLFATPRALLAFVLARSRAADAELAPFVVRRTDVYMLAVLVAQMWAAVTGGAHPATRALAALVARMLRLEVDAAAADAQLRALAGGTHGSP
jgi:hypothetical protein